jgi:hypothetical protein
MYTIHSIMKPTNYLFERGEKKERRNGNIMEG